ncbi:MAG: FtsX-like permease family protein, partial [Candidatus Heimdallarchaeota archaeon]
KVKYYYKLLLLNRKNTFIMFLGLGISRALIAEVLIFIYSFQYDAFSDFNKEIPTRQFTIIADNYDYSDVNDVIIEELSNRTERALENVGMDDRILRTDWIAEKGAIMYLDSYIDGADDLVLYDWNIFGIPADYFSAFESILYNGTMPHNKNEFIAVSARKTIETTNLSKMGTFPMYVPMLSWPPNPMLPIETGIPNAGKYVNVSGLVTSEDFRSYKGNGTLTQDMLALDEYFTENFLLTTYENVMSFANDVQYYQGTLRFVCRFAFNLEKVDAFNIAGEISNLNRLSQEIFNVFEDVDYPITVTPDLSDVLLEFNKEFLIFQLFGILFITPLIGMALSLTNYSTNLMKRRQKQQVSNMLQRGSSQKEVVTLLIMQVVEITVMAVLVCVVIGYPFAALMIKSNGFLAFSGVSKFPAINMVIFYAIIGAAFVFSTIVNARNVFDMSKITTDEAYGAQLDKKPFWEKTFIDILLMLVGIALWLIVLFQLRGTSAYAFAYGLGTTAPVCFILGAILMATRLYPYFANFLANRSWNIPKLGIISLSMKRSLRRRSSVIRSLVLIALTFTLIITSLTTIQSYQHYDTETAYYALGSDILVRNVNVENDNIKNTVNSIEGIEASTYIKFTSQITTFGELTYSYIVVGVNASEYSQIGYFEKDYLGGQTPEEFFDKLNNPLDVLMQKDEIANIATFDGDSFTLIVGKYAIGDVNYTLNVAGVYNYFPRFFVNYPDMDSTVFRFTIIGDYDIITNLAYSHHDVAGDLLVKVKDGYSITDVADVMEFELGRSVDTVEDLMGAYDGSLRNTMLYGSLNTSFISSIIITVAGISLMIIIQSIENEKEVVMLKTLGTSPKQLFSMFTAEALIVVTFGSLIGLGIGVFAAKMFLEILTLDNVLPPAKLVFAPLEVSLAFILLFFTAIVAAAFTSWLVFRKDTIKAIKQI